ncbi:FRG domain-containing protein [Adhaeribacter arboris]|uniref:FRG domain-containing protein n=1 Tax=Adhaeribacter arboris TaxID=2072846 RepID=A0A2T2YJS3_9BACT|nr:FRG domain-containing protein [Adhaeribacter arboris]PSR55764.1 FRG domain-containing protein [Adhaeribacter arboris]
MEEIETKFGIETEVMESWSEFITFIDVNSQYRQFIWRGQADSSWLLEPTISRVLKKYGKVDNEKTINTHLQRFKYATRGRRGPTPSILEKDDYWWALGQHQGLNTPLLDWSKSPFVAAFFAYERYEVSSTTQRTVYGISQTAIARMSDIIKKQHLETTRPSIIEFIEPFSDDNARLVNQNGLFTRSPSGIDIESWIKSRYKEDEENVVMWKILLPDTERENALRSLNRMNINHLTLFPDLYGASKFANMNIEIKSY